MLAADVNGKTQVVLTFGGAFTQNGSLVDGDYKLQIDPTKILNGGAQLDGGLGPGTVFADEFFRLFGDANADGTVNLFDFAGFRATFGKGDGDVGYRDAFDENGDGVINLFDFAAFRANLERPIELIASCSVTGRLDDHVSQRWIDIRKTWPILDRFNDLRIDDWIAHDTPPWRAASANDSKSGHRPSCSHADSFKIGV